MYWVMVLVGALGAAAAAVLGLGARLPREHVVARQIRLAQPLEAVWERVSNRAAEPTWRKGLRGISREADREGHAVWREQGGDGLLAEEVVVEPPRRLVRRILENSMFGGEWEFRLEVVAGGCTLTVTERGEVYHPLFRFVSRYVIGHTRTIDGYLRALAASVGEAAAIEEARPAPAESARSDASG